MEFNQEIKATGKLKIEIFGSDGHLKDVHSVDNLVVTVGKNFIASRMVGTASAIMTHMSIGTGTAAASGGNTTLGTEVSRVGLGSQTASTNTVSYTASFASGVGTGAITEAGIFNAGSAGTMLCHTVFAVVNKAAGDAVNITWVITIS